MTILFEDDAIQAVYRPGSSAFTLITFGDKDVRPTPGRFWASGPAERLDLDAIGIVAKGPNWYPAAAMERCASFLLGVGRETRLGYGYSMGGYAALRYGRLLGMTHALSVAPQSSLDPMDVPWDQRYAVHFDPAIHAGMAVKAEHVAPGTVVLADPWDAYDGAHLRLISGVAPVRSVATPFVGHWAIWLLARRNVLGHALQCVLAGDVVTLRRLMRRVRSSCPPWYGCLAAAALRHGHLDWATRLAQQADAKGFDRTALIPMLACGAGEVMSRMASAGAPIAELIGFAEAATELVASEARVADAMGHALLGTQRNEEAEAAFRRALSGDPDLAAAHSGLSLALTRLGRREEALTHAQRAVALDPANPELPAWVGYVLVQLGRQDEAVGLFRQGLRMNPRMGHAHLALARTLRELGRMREALEAAEDGCRNVPSDARLPELAATLRQAAGGNGARRPGWRRLSWGPFTRR